MKINAKVPSSLAFPEAVARHILKPNQFAWIIDRISSNTQFCLALDDIGNEKFRDCSLFEFPTICTKLREVFRGKNHIRYHTDEQMINHRVSP